MAKKICIISTVHPALDTRIFAREAATLALAGYDVTLVAQYSGDETLRGIKIIALDKPSGRFNRVATLGKKAYSIALRQQADIYNFHDPELLPWMARLKAKTGAKVIYDVHEDVPKQIRSKYWIPFFLRPVSALAVDVLERRYARQMDKIIAATGSIAKRFPAKITSVVKNYPDTSVIDAAAAEPFDKSRPVAIYAGAIAEIRGIHQIIQAAKKTDGAIGLMLVGSFAPAALEQEILAPALEKYVTYRGQLPFAKMCSVMKSCDMGLVTFLPEPNHIEALPNKLFEYMAAGLPVIASDFPLWKKIVEGNKCGLCVNPNDSGAIARAMEYFATNPVRAKAMGEAGKRAVAGIYNWDSESKKFLEIYGLLAKQ